MVCRANDEKTLTMLVVRAKNRDGGFYLALIPDNLDTGQIQEGLAELGIDPRQVLEISGWEKAAVGLAAAFVPLP